MTRGTETVGVSAYHRVEPAVSQSDWRRRRLHGSELNALYDDYSQICRQPTTYRTDHAGIGHSHPPPGQGLGYVRMRVMNEGEETDVRGDVCCIRLHASSSRTQLGDVCDRRLHSAVCSVEMECVASWLGRLSVCPSVTSTRTVLRSQHNNRVD